MNINISSDRSDPNSDEYLDVTASHAMLPAHEYPTRNMNCLDHIILKTNKKSITLVLDSLITDHSPVMLFCDLSTSVPPSKSTIKRTDIPAVITELEKTDFSFILNNEEPEAGSQMLIDKLTAIVESHSRTVLVRKKNQILKPWITSGLLRCMRHRDKLFRKTRKSPGDETLKKIYIRYRNFCNKLLKKVKREFEHKEFLGTKSKPKAAWNLIKRVANIETKKGSQADLLRSAKDNVSAVNEVNKFFASIGETLATKVRSLNNNCSVTNIQDPCFQSAGQSNSMALYSCDKEEIDSIILGLRNDCATGWDDISCKLLKQSRHILAPVLTHLFNTCLQKGIFPTVFKRALIHPIYKSGDRGSVNNYRPIAILSSISKVLEKILNNRLTKYLNKYDILSNNQYGFRSGRSTEDAIMDLTGTITTSLDRKEKVVGMFLDLSKAFDTVSVPILVRRLEEIGVRGTALDIFKDYLRNRSQRVKIGNFLSQDETLTYGVPQGSVLGPTLFLIYINQLCNLNLPNTKICAYADDMALIVHGKNWVETRDNAERALKKIMIWLSSSLLSLNVEKSKYLTFSIRKNTQPQQSFSIKAHTCKFNIDTCTCNTLDHADSVKYLGLILDSTLSWAPQINKLVGQTRKMIYIFRSLKPILDIKALKTVYFALVQSLLTYCVTIWGNCGKTLLLRLERAQRAILKIMHGKPILFSTRELYSLADVLTVRQLYILHVVLRKHKEEQFDPRLPLSRRRFDRVCQIKPCRTELALRHYFYTSSIIYNKVNKYLNIYPVNYQHCKVFTTKWLKTLSYNDAEEFITRKQ